ncbi:MAG: lysylphosphatidylglycerol synthase transmembrane domain-containing protein [Pseudomonadota bacterium]
MSQSAKNNRANLLSYDGKRGNVLNKTSFLFLILSFLLCFWIVWHYRELFHLILKIKPGYAILLFLLFAVIQVVNGYRIFTIVRFFGLRMKRFDWIGIPYVTSYLNYLPINAGLGATAVFLKKQYDLPYTKFVSISGALLLIQMFCFSTLGLFLMGLIRIIKGPISYYLDGAFLLILLAIIVFRFVPVGFIRGESRITNWFKSSLDGFDDIRKDRSLIVSLMLQSYIQLGLTGLTIYFTFMSLGLLVNYLDGLLIGIVTSVLKQQLLFFMPGQLGIREVFIAGITKIIQGSFGDGVVVAFTDRIVTGVTTIILGNFFIWKFMQRLKG